jgi:hypothetical protein
VGSARRRSDGSDLQTGSDSAKAMWRCACLQRRGKHQLCLAQCVGFGSDGPDAADITRPKNTKRDHHVWLTGRAGPGGRSGLWMVQRIPPRCPLPVSYSQHWVAGPLPAIAGLCPARLAVWAGRLPGRGLHAPLVRPSSWELLVGHGSCWLVTVATLTTPSSGGDCGRLRMPRRTDSLYLYTVRW